LLEDLPEFALALTIVLAHDLGARERDEVGIHLVRDGLCDQGLSRPRRAVEEDSPRGIDSQALEELGVAERKLDHLPHHLELPGKSTNVLVMDICSLALLLL